MYPDFKEFLYVFNAHSVKYLIVGGSVSLYAQPRSTKDIDLLVRPDAGNAKAVYAALAQFGAPTEGLTPEDFAERGSFFRLGHELLPWTSFPRSPALILTLHGNAGLRMSSRSRPDSRRISFPAPIS
jgi:hypothetical protein